MAAIFDLAESVDRQTPKIRRMLRYVRVFVSVWLLLDFFLIIVLAAIGGGNPGAAFLLFIPIIALLFAMRRISGSTVRLVLDRKSTRLNSSHGYISYAVFCLKKKNK